MAGGLGLGPAHVKLGVRAKSPKRDQKIKENTYLRARGPIGPKGSKIQKRNKGQGSQRAQRGPNPNINCFCLKCILKFRRGAPGPVLGPGAGPLAQKYIWYPFGVDWGLSNIYILTFKST